MNIKTFPDISTGKLGNLGINKTFDTVRKFLESDNIQTPMSIAIHGEWGSGKTNFLKALKQNLKQEDFKIIFFDAWKHEYGNPSIALLNEILYELRSSGDIVSRIIKLATNVFVQKYTGLKIPDLINELREGYEASKTLSDEIKEEIASKIKGKKCVILIDDLDRCDAENSLQILTLVKLFLDIENCICIAAVDFGKLEKAWLAKYGQSINFKDTGMNEEGRKYLEKIFQLRISIPKPKISEVYTYLKKIVPEFPEEITVALSNLGPDNPRAIKRMLNLITYRTILIGTNDGYRTAIFWTLLEEKLGSEKTCKLFARFSHIIHQDNSTPLGFTHYFFSDMKKDLMHETVFEELKNIDEHYENQDPDGYEVMDILYYCHEIYSKSKDKEKFDDDLERLFESSNETLRLD